MTIPKTKEEIEILRNLAKIHKLVFEEITKIALPWVSAKLIDELVENICNSYNVLPAFKWLYWFPASICVNINEMVAHWIPTEDMVFKDWDIVSFDFWVKDKESWLNTDAAFTMIIWEPKIKEHADIVRINEEALMKGIAKAKTWNRTWDIGHAIEKHIKESWFHLIKKLSWHWIWKEVHEKPYIYNYGEPKTGELLKENQTFCLEPLLWLTTGEIIHDEHWNIVTADWNIWTHFEHMIIIKNGYPEILV